MTSFFDSFALRFTTVVALALVYLILSIFRAALSSIMRAYSPLNREAAPRVGKGWPGPPPERLRMSVQGTRQVCLIVAALMFVSAFDQRGWAWAPVWAFASAILLFSFLIDQVAARSLALIDPVRAFRITLPVATILSAPLRPFVEPVRLLLESLRKNLSESAEMARDQDSTSGDERDAALEAERLQEAQGEIIENVVEFSGTVVREIMTPRTEMATIEEDGTLEALIELARRRNHSRIPVTRDGVDHVVGLVHVRDILGLWGSSASGTGFDSLVRPVLSVPESKLALDLLKELQAKGQQMAIVVDEYGGTSGLVTVEDLLEEVVGEIADEHETRRPDLQGQQDGSYVVRGAYPVYDLAERLNVELPDGMADSIGGLIVALLGHLPQTGEWVDVGSVRLEVAEADHRRVRRVRIYPAGALSAGEVDQKGAGER